MTNLIIVPEEQLETKIKSAVRASLVEFEKEKALNSPEKYYTINAVAKRLRKAHATIKKYIDAGLLKTTKSGLISEYSINEFLETK